MSYKGVPARVFIPDRRVMPSVTAVRHAFRGGRYAPSLERWQSPEADVWSTVAGLLLKGWGGPTGAVLLIR